MTEVLTRGAGQSVAPPKSISTAWTVVATLTGALAACYYVFWLRPDLDSHVTALLLMASVFIPGAMVEMFVNEAPEKSGLDFAWRRLSLARVSRKIAALWTIYALLAIGYWAFPFYEGKSYEPFRWLLHNLGWLLVVASLPYVAAVDTFQTEPEDTLWSLGDQLFRLSFRPSAKEINYLLGWVVKGFFLPLMYCYLIQNIESLRSTDYGSYTFLPAYYYDVTYTALYFVDLMFGVVGYAATLRLLGTEIRSVEPTLLGWVVALACYEPFWGTVSRNYISYGHSRPWGSLFADAPVLYCLWGGAILLLVLVYVWATVIFGIRFSNLTNRGIITNGPYRWTKHPAYVSKNLSWWMISIPFLPPDGSVITALKLSAMLGAVNIIYYLRAKTEERHLSQDPVYREYAAFVNKHGLFARMRRAAGFG